jgi:ferrochelatase
MNKEKTNGILLANLGTPADPSPAAVRRFLSEMLSDPRLVELPRILWLPILHGIVLRLRPQRSARAYQAIWTQEGSPQLAIGRRLVGALRTALNQTVNVSAAVELGMSYGQPSIPEALVALQSVGAERIIVLPLYPQYSGATTASVFDRVTEELRRRRVVPELRFINEYHAAPGYIEALRQSVLDHWRIKGRAPHLLMSFHGLPKRNSDRGDPYAAQCEQTARLLAQALDLQEGEWSLGFQSRFGFQEWLKPYTVDSLTKLARNGLKRVNVICPGFAVDCLETLEEIAIRAGETFTHNGGESLDYIPALNDRGVHVNFLAKLAAQLC